MLDVRALLQDAAIEDVEMEDAPDDVPVDPEKLEEDEDDDEEAMDLVRLKRTIGLLNTKQQPSHHMKLFMVRKAMLMNISLQKAGKTVFNGCLC